MNSAPSAGLSFWLKALSVMLLGLLLTLGMEGFDQRQSESEQARQLETRLKAAAYRLERSLDLIVQTTYDLAAALPEKGPADNGALDRHAEALMQRHPAIINFTWSEGLEVVFVHPFAGNDAVLGMNYANRPYIMTGVQRAIEQQGSVITGPVSLVQSSRQGLVGRTPVFLAGQAKTQENLRGVVSVAIDFALLLAESGLDEPRLAIRGRDASGANGDVFHGDVSIFKERHVAVDVSMAGGSWRLGAQPGAPAGGVGAQRLWLIRGFGLSITLAALAWLTTRRRAPEAGKHPRHLFGLRGALSGTVLLLFLPTITVSGWISWRNAQESADKFSREIAAATSARVSDRVIEFFDVPRRIVAHNVEQARAGLLDDSRRDDMMRGFLLQIRQQPLLTFVSVGLADGEYYAGSRPPLGSDRGLRLLHARQADGRAMHIYRVDDAARRTTLVTRANQHFDARTRPWFKAAVERGKISWYPAYRYVINDTEGAYDTLGIGMSAPLRDPAGRLIGVTTADVALSQLSRLLRDAVPAGSGIAFIAEEDGTLLARSDEVPVYREEAGKTERLKLSQANHPALQAAGAELARGQRSEGTAALQAGPQGYLFDWRTHHLEQGPRVLIGVVSENAGLGRLADGLWRNILYQGLAIAAFGLLIGLLASAWIARPLRELSARAGRLADGQWQRGVSANSPVLEVNRLYEELDRTAQELQRHTQHLEHQAVELEITNQTLRTARDAAEAASKAKSAFLANMSHELRTPMHGILGMLSLVRNRLTEPRQQQQLDMAREAANRLLLIINDILDISKIEAEQLTLEHIPFHPGEVLDSTTGLLSLRAAQKGLALEVDCPPELARLALLGDPLRLGQILLNLAGNAIKFTEQGSVTIRLREEAARNQRRVLRFDIIDTGIGIAEAVRPRLFHAFEQADNSTTRRYGGTGLGLAISKRLVDMMEGEIGVESVAGEGSCFWFRIPLPEVPHDPAEDSQAAAQTDDAALLHLRQQFAGARILLAEDEPINQEVARGLLEDADLVVDIANNGEEACQCAARQQYDLILMDMQMPLIDGLEATRAIRAGQLNAQTPILAMTANAFAEDRQRCLAAGMNDHLGKPVIPDVLYETLARWLAR